MKTRITAVFAVLVVALSLVAAASAAPRQSNMKASHAPRPSAFDWEW